MEFIHNITRDDLGKLNKPTFNQCEHFLAKADKNTMQTLVIEVAEGKHITVCIMPDSESVDVQFHGDHQFGDFGQIKAFHSYNNPPA